MPWSSRSESYVSQRSCSGTVTRPLILPWPNVPEWEPLRPRLTFFEVFADMVFACGRLRTAGRLPGGSGAEENGAGSGQVGNGYATPCVQGCSVAVPLHGGGLK